MQVATGYDARPQFVALHQRRERWAIGVCHRRAGKTVACVNDLIDAALRLELPRPRFAYIAPTYTQAKDVVWSYLKDYTAAIPGTLANESELRVDLPGDRRIRLYGADNYDRMRGLYFDGVVCDEFGDIDPRAWSEVIRPALSDRKGWAVFIGTPKGRNHFAELWDQAKNDPDWFKMMLRASESGILDPAELADARKSMTEDQFEAEYECSFQAGVIGAYYSREIQQAEKDKRIGRVPYDPSLPVTTAWDLGIGDSTAIWFAQAIGMEVRIVDYYEASGQALDHYVKVLRERPYLYGEHLLPHDAEVRELGTGKTRVETLAKLGLRCKVLPVQSVDDGINAVRMLLPRCWMDETKCARGIDALRQYRKDWDAKLRTFRERPLHDWSSHAADAFRYLAEGLRAVVPDVYARSRRDRGAKRSWLTA